MKLTRAVCSAMLVAVGPLWAVAGSPEVRTSTKVEARAEAKIEARTDAKSSVSTSIPAVEAPAAQAPGGLIPRPNFKKPAANEMVMPANSSGRLVVKFRDDVKARVQQDGTVRSVAGRNLDAADASVRGRGLTFKPTILLPQEKINELQAKAMAFSNRMQPDLSGMIYVEAPGGGNPQAIEQAARALVVMDEVEWVEFEPIYNIHPDCDDEDPDCGAPLACVGDCFECHDPMDFAKSGGRYCADPICCAIVCAIDPFCCEENVIWPSRGVPNHWDALCVARALANCPGSPVENANCFLPGNESCYSPHDSAACSPSGCCATVCALDQFCCQGNWDADCVVLANQFCPVVPVGAPTPTFAAHQGYLTQLTYLQQSGVLLGGALQDPCEPGEPLFGFDGTGMDLDALWQYGEFMINQYGVADENLTRGKTIKIGVIEHTAFVDWTDNNNPLTVHEDLRGHVIAEPGQTIVFGPAPALSGNHGTACLGIIGAKDDGTKGHGIPTLDVAGDEVGVVGIAPDAELYFFPIVSLEEGGRLTSAIANALTIFGPGDVLSFSIGGGGGTLASGQAGWTMLRLAADMGVTCCISAGNDNSNLDGTAQFQGEESDCIIVGAVTPGTPFCRLPFSNYCQECEGANKVHISAWGEGVTTLAYGDLWNDGSVVRSYTNSFNGTSAAAPQIAGLVANLQGFAKMLRGIPLTPAQLRAALMAAQPCVGVATPGFSQCGFCGGTPPGGNVDLDPGADPNWVADPGTRLAYPIPLSGAQDIVQMSFDFNTWLNDVTIIRGEHVFGNLLSLRIIDQSYFIVRSQFTERRHVPNMPAPAGAVRYYGTGQTTDIMVSFIPDIPVNNNAAVTVGVNAPQPIGITFVETYEWNLKRWIFTGLLNLPGGGGQVVGAFPLPAGMQFQNPHDNKVYVRVYTLAPGNQNVGFGSSMNDGTFFMQHDVVAITVQQNFPGGILLDFGL